MLKQNYRPPPCEVRDSILFFYRYFSIDQTSADSDQFIKKKLIPPMKENE